MTDYNNRWARKPKEESKISLYVTKKYFAYDSDGVFKGEVTLNSDRKRQYEAKGFTFRPTK